MTTEQKIALEYLDQLYYLSMEVSVDKSKNETYLDMQTNLENIIAQTTGEGRTLLRLRYINFCLWPEIQERMFISESTRKRKHKKALSQVYNILIKLDLIDPLRGQV